MNRSAMAHSGIVLVVLLALARPLLGQVTDSTLLRPTDVTVTIRNDRENDGVYRAHGISRICGKKDYMMPHRANAFVVEFPDDEPNLAVRSISFDADTLAPGKITNSFLLNIGIRTPDGGTPPLYVLRPKQPQYNEPGTAERTKIRSRDSLTVVGVATKGTRVDVRMTVACHPLP